MAIPFKNNLDIGQNQLLNAVLQKDSGGPSGPVAGQVYFNTQTGRAYYYNGSAWVGMDSEGATMTGADIITAINAADSGAINEARLTVTHPTKATLGLDNVTNNAQVKKRASSTSGNIPAWDGASGDALTDGYGVETSMTGGASAFATAAAVKTYVDNQTAAVDAMRYKGVIDASANPNYPAAVKGDTYRISVAGKIGGASGLSVEVGDMVIALDTAAAGNQAAVGAKWNIIQTNIDGAVTGPASATGNNFAAFDGATGKLIKDSGNKAADFAAASHTHSYTSKYSANLTASATQTVTHGLNTEDVVVMIREAAGDKQQVFADVKITGVNTISIAFAVAPSANQYRVTVIG